MRSCPNPILIRRCLLIVLTLTMGASFFPSYGHAATANTVTVAPVHIINLTPFAGKFVHVFFVDADAPLLTLTTGASARGGQQLEFNKILLPPARVQISPRGTADIPTTQVPKNFVNGFAKTYNYVFVAVTEALPNPLYLKNEDGAQRPIFDPRLNASQLGQLPDASFQVVQSAFISKIGLLSHLKNGLITLDGLTDLHQ